VPAPATTADAERRVANKEKQYEVTDWYFSKRSL
jgi:hypothetical protein